MADEFKLITIDEAEKAALKVFDSIFDKRKAMEAKIDAAKQRTKWVRNVANKEQVMEIEKMYGEDKEETAHHVRFDMHAWLTGYWIPGLRQSHSMADIKSRNPAKNSYMQDLAMWKYMEKIWFKADDFRYNKELKEIVQFIRVRLWGSDDQPGIDFF
ncbi:MAG: hypothetical protein Q9213_000685 [Squamulea squamosa]